MGSATYSQAFNAALTLVMHLEGGDAITDDPDDPGGLTRWGISQRSHPAVDIRALTRETAAAIYHRDYWHPVRGDELPPAIAIAVFEGAVHLGARPAVRCMQQALGVAPDGIVGPTTLRAAQARGAQVLPRYMALRAQEYLRQVAAQPKKAKFLPGWLARLFETLFAVMQMQKEAQ